MSANNEVPEQTVASGLDLRSLPIKLIYYVDIMTAKENLKVKSQWAQPKIQKA